MTKREFWILNVSSLMLAALLLSHFSFARHNAQAGNQLAREQAAINTANSLKGVLNRLSMRIARGSEADPNLKTILRKYGLNVTLEVDGKKKTYP